MGLWGAVGGLAADLATGGLTLDGGMLVGGALSALGAGGVARTCNMSRGDDATAVRWSEPFFAGLVRSALLRYLAVAHFGRGRGERAEDEHPAFWLEAIATLLQRRQAAIRTLWDVGRRETADNLQPRLAALMTGCAAELLASLYPQARTILAAELAAAVQHLGEDVAPTWPVFPT